jgi:hypothetical protein
VQQAELHFGFAIVPLEASFMAKEGVKEGTGRSSFSALKISVKVLVGSDGSLWGVMMCIRRIWI